MSTQIKRVEDYLRENHSITSFEAITKLGVTRLAAHIHELRKGGMNIDKETVQVGGGTYVAKYFLRNEGDSDSE